MTSALDHLVGTSPALTALRKRLEALAVSEHPVLVLGETGTGKELVARALHALSPRSMRSLVAVNCAALSPEMIDSELFGHVRGSFTGAQNTRRGLIAQAEHGTLFLDEIGDMPPACQARLLRFLDSGEVRPVGSDRSISINVRVVAATNRPASSLRGDLYYRLQGLTVSVPPLREHTEDVGPLLMHFGAGQLQWSECAREALAAYSWPGNVRELRALVDLCRTTFAPGTVITRGLLPPHLGAAPELPAAATGAPRAIRGLRLSVDELEGGIIREALDTHGWNVAAAARSLGIGRTTLAQKLRRRDVRVVRVPAPSGNSHDAALAIES